MQKHHLEKCGGKRKKFQISNICSIVKLTIIFILASEAKFCKIASKASGNPVGTSHETLKYAIYLELDSALQQPLLIEKYQNLRAFMNLNKKQFESGLLLSFKRMDGF